MAGGAAGVEFAGFDPHATTVADLARLRAALPSRLRRTFLTPLAAPLVEPLRWVKDEDELRILSEAALMGCKLFEHILGFIRPGLAEFEVAAELEHQARLLGAEGMSFETIVASGVRSALPHGRATASLLPRRGFLTLDFGIIREGYCSDMTRTVHLGKAECKRARNIPGSARSAGSRSSRCERWRKLRGCGRGSSRRAAQGGFG